MTDPAAAFMQAIVANPADDTPRLVYADWLDEHDQPERAEFIRLQCFVASEHRAMRMTDGKHHERIAELLQKNGYQFAYPGIDPESWERLPNTGWLRGFVAEIRCTCADWLQHGPRLVQAQPLERVTLSDKRPQRVGQSVWTWSIGIGTDELPASLYPRILGETELLPCYYRSEASALDALSAVCLAWAKAYTPPFERDAVWDRMLRDRGPLVREPRFIIEMTF